MSDMDPNIPNDHDRKPRWRPVDVVVLVMVLTIAFVFAFVGVNHLRVGRTLDIEHSEILAAVIGSMLGVVATYVGMAVRK